MKKSELKQIELDRVNQLIGLGDLSLIPLRTVIESEIAGYEAQEQGTSYRKVSADDLTTGVLQVETLTVVGTVTAVAQVETATVAGTIGAAGAGNASVVITAEGMTGTPKTKTVAVANNDTAAQVADKIRIALAADTDVTALFAVSGTGTSVILTKLVAVANDTTLNIAIDNDTCSGLTPAASSANSTAGSAGTGNATVVFTSAHTTGSPITLNVAVIAGDTAAQVATKVRAALVGNADIAAQFTIGGTGAAVVVTAKDFFGNDTTLNVSINNGTCTGLTQVASSANTTAGVAASEKLTVTTGTTLCVADEEGFNLELPAAAAVLSQKFTVMKIDNGAGEIVISTNASEKINGQDTYTLDDQYDSVTVISDGANYFIVSKIAAD